MFNVSRFVGFYGIMMQLQHVSYVVREIANLAKLLK